MEAKYYDGRTAQRTSVHVDILTDRIVFRKTDDKGKYDWFFRDLVAEKISDNILILRNHLIPDARLEIENAHIARTLQSKLSFRASVIWTEDVRVLTGVVVFFVLFVATIFWFLDDMGEAIVEYLPRSQEAAIFGDYVEILSLKKCKATNTEVMLSKLSQRLMTKLEQREFKVLYVQDSQVNAFALPGGLIVVNSGLTQEIHHGDELAGVLAHEIEHQARRHIAKSLLKNSFVGIVGRALLGGNFGHFGSLLTSLKFSRDAESEADLGAGARLDNAGISRLGLAHFLKRLSQMTKLPQILSTHPLDGRESQLLTSYDQYKKLSPALSDVEFKNLKAEGCSP